MFRTIPHRIPAGATKHAIIAGSIALAVSSMGCGNGELQALLLPHRTVTIVVENQTAFAAAPEISTGGGRNIVEDLFVGKRPVAGLGAAGTIAARGSETFRLACNGDLELVELHGATFRAGGGLTLGSADDFVQLRRDVDFDCGDTIRIRFSGGIFSFRSSVDVEPASDTLAPGGIRPGILAPPIRAPADDDRDLGDILDDLFD